jgi:hypothetical protein
VANKRVVASAPLKVKRQLRSCKRRDFPGQGQGKHVFLTLTVETANFSDSVPKKVTFGLMATRWLTKAKESFFTLNLDSHESVNRRYGQDIDP